MVDVVLSGLADFWQQLVAAVAAVAGGIIARFLLQKRAILKRQRKKSNLPLQVQNAMKINTLLTEARVLTEADRVYIYQFSNGTYYTTAVSQLNMTCTHEVVKSGVSAIGPSNSPMLVTHFPFLFAELLSTPISEHKTQDVRDYHLQQMMLRLGTQSFLALPVYDSDGYMDAWMGIDYLNVDHRLGTNEAELRDRLTSIATRLGATLRGDA